jgi:ribokinase
MSAAFDVAVCGSLHLDVVVRAPALPVLDETAVGTERQFKCGGKGGNQAVMASRMGARTAMIGRVGEDDFGRTLLGNLEAAGVDRRAVRIDPAAGSGMSVAIVVPGGDYGAVIVSGSNLAIAPEAIAADWAALGGARVLLLQNEVREPVNLAAARVAREAGALVVLNAAPARPLPPALLEQVDVLVLNRVEAALLGGRVVEGGADAMEAISRQPPGGPALVITLGGDGLVVRPRGGGASWLPPHAVTPVSAHGAGDCFLGALAARLAAGSELIDGCRWANAAAALFVGMEEAAQQRLAPAVVDAFLAG